MSNHFHILLEVVPEPEVGISDGELLKRLGAIHTAAAVAVVAKELAGAREAGNQGHAEALPRKAEGRSETDERNQGCCGRSVVEFPRSEVEDLGKAMGLKSSERSNSVPDRPWHAGRDGDALRALLRIDG